MAVPVADLPPTTLALGWLPQASRPEIVSFARSLQRIAADRGSTPRLRGGTVSIVTVRLPELGILN